MTHEIGQIDFAEVLRKAFNVVCQKETRRGTRMKELFEQYAYSEPVEFVLSTHSQSQEDHEFAARMVACQTVCTPGPSDANELHSMCYTVGRRAAKLLLCRIFENIKILIKDGAYGGSIVNLNVNESLEFKTSSGSLNRVSCFQARPEFLRAAGSTARITTFMLLDAAHIGKEFSCQIVGPALTLQLSKIMVFSGGENTPISWIQEMLLRIDADREAFEALSAMKRNADASAAAKENKD